MHPEEFTIGVGAGAAAAHMAPSAGEVTSTAPAGQTPAVVAAIREATTVAEASLVRLSAAIVWAGARIRKHAPLPSGRGGGDGRAWPTAVGFVCAKELPGRCVEVPGGGEH